MTTQLANVLISRGTPGGWSTRAVFTRGSTRLPSLIDVPRFSPPSAEPNAPPRTLADPPIVRAAIVDDDVDAAETLADVLRDLGCEVRTAYDGVSGTALILGTTPELVLLDIGLPDQSGLEVMQRLRPEPALADTRFVAVSGYTHDADRQRSLQAGFDEHLAKPIHLATLERLVAELPRLHHA